MPFDISIGLPLPGSPDSWEPFNPTFLGLGAPGFVRSPDPAQSPDLWASQDRQLLPPYYLMSSGSSGVLHASSAVDVSSDVHHDIKAHAAAQCTVTACCRASAGEAVVYTLDSCRLHGSSVGSMEDPLSQTPGPGTLSSCLCHAYGMQSLHKGAQTVTWHDQMTLLAGL